MWLLKNIPSDTYCARYSSETTGFLTTKKLWLFLHTVCCTQEPKKKVICQLFLFEFSTTLATRTELMGIWILATVLYGNLLGSALLFSPQNCQHKITQNRVCNAFWWVFEWFSVIVITLEHVGHIPLRSNPICSRSDVANRKSSYPLIQRPRFARKSWKIDKTMLLPVLEWVSAVACKFSAQKLDSCWL